MTSTGLSEGIEALRRAGLFPTQQRVTAAGLVFSGPTLALTPTELQERAVDSGMYISEQEAETTLAEFRGAGMVPLKFESTGMPAFNLSQAARVLQAMGNPHRLKILRELIPGERCAGDLGRAVGLQPSALSQHLSRLKADGLVQQRREASRIFYSLAGQAAQSVMRSLAA